MADIKFNMKRQEGASQNYLKNSEVQNPFLENLKRKNLQFTTEIESSQDRGIEYDGTVENDQEENDKIVIKSGKKEDEKSTEKKVQEQNKSSSSEHDGKYFVIQKGMCKCDQGFKFPKFKVTSHQKHYWNNKEGEADYLAVTEDDMMLDPPAMPFGQCKLQPIPGGYLPCSYAPVGKWQKPYDKVKVMGYSCLTELSELQCAIGGKITIMKHGQQSEAGKSNVKKADAREQQVYNPIVDVEEFKEQIEDSNEYS